MESSYLRRCVNCSVDFRTVKDIHLCEKCRILLTKKDDPADMTFNDRLERLEAMLEENGKLLKELGRHFERSKLEKEISSLEQHLHQVERNLYFIQKREHLPYVTKTDIEEAEYQRTVIIDDIKKLRERLENV